MAVPDVRSSVASRAGRRQRLAALLVPAVLATVLATATATAAAADEAPARVRLVRPPSGGIQPQAVCDPSGVIHVVYLAGDRAACDVFVTRLEPGADAFGPPVRVNSEPGSAVALGTIRGAQLALGRGGRLHVAWNGSKGARPENPNGGAPMLYARSDPAGTAFEPQRNLMRGTTALDGGGTVAADEAGRVVVAWHGRRPDDPEGEDHRRLFVARSDDDGATFAAESPALPGHTGACPCCGTRALAGAGDALYLLFRAATFTVDRDLMLLTSHDRGDHFTARRLDPWHATMCPMSSESLAAGAGVVVAAWETKGQVYFCRLDPRTGRASRRVHPRGAGGNRKHPSVAVNPRGAVALAWAEDTTFQRGGSLCWRVFDPSDRPTPTTGRLDSGIPLSGLPTVVATPDGSFTIVH